MEVGGEGWASHPVSTCTFDHYPSGVGNWLSLRSNGKRWIGEDTIHGSLFNRIKKQCYYFAAPPSPINLTILNHLLLTHIRSTCYIKILENSNFGWF